MEERGEFVKRLHDKMSLKIYINFFLLIFTLLSCESDYNNRGKSKDLTGKGNSQKQIQDPKKIEKTGLVYSSIPQHYIDSLFNVKKGLSKFEEQRFLDVNHSHRYNTALVIGKLFSTNEKFAIKAYKINDTLLNLTILIKNQAIWKKILEQQIINYDFINEKIIDISDINGNGTPGLKVLKSAFMVHNNFFQYAWLYVNHEFLKIDGFEKLSSVEYSKRNKTLNSYFSYGCADLNMFFGEYKILKNKIYKFNEVYCDCCNEKICEIKINKLKPIKVEINQAYNYVPDFYKDRVKEKLSSQNK